jgi:hypothetical protein
MTNQSKLNNPRFWQIWEESGAVGGIGETELRIDVNYRRNVLNSIGNLTRREVTKLTRLEYREDRPSIQDQVRRYYLDLKSTNPPLASRLDKETQPILTEGVQSEGDVMKLCTVLHRYLSGFVIVYRGRAHTSSTQEIS